MRPLTYLFVTLFAATAAVAPIGASGGSIQDLPKPIGRVNDFANVIDATTEAEIDRRLDQLERDTSSEIAVATVQSLGGTSVEDYANRLFKEWGVGQAGADNGVLVLVAIDDRAMKIEVGYGLEGILPDGLAGQVIRDEFTPRFRDNDYSGGIRNGVNRLADIVEKQQVLTAEELAAFNDEASTTVPSYILIPFIAIFVGIGFMLFGAGIRTKTIFPLLFGGFFGGMPLLLALLISFLPAVLILVPFAIFMFIFGRRLGARPGWMASMRQEAEREAGSPVSGWKMGTTSSSSSSSSDDDSGSSSSSSSSSSSDFGGGSSGGGGASGRW